MFDMTDIKTYGETEVLVFGAADIDHLTDQEQKEVRRQIERKTKELRKDFERMALSDDWSRN